MSGTKRWTVEDLERLDACGDQVAVFREAFPDGATVEDVPKASALGLNVGWLVKRVVAHPHLMAYREAIAPHGRAYQEAIEAHWRAYQEAIAPHGRAYEEAIAQRVRAYQEAIAAHLMAALRTVGTEAP